MRGLFIIALIVFGLDRLTKQIVVEEMGLKYVGSIDVFPPFLNFRMAWNYGVNFGLFGSDSDGLRWALIALALAICVGLIIWAARAKSKWIPISAGFVVGGAIGNVWDRVQYGAVADFLNMSCCGITNPYAFNIADIAIFLGAVALILFSGGKEKGA